MGVVLGLALGVGLILVWTSFTAPRRPRATRSVSSRLHRLLERAAMTGLGVPGLITACVVAAILTGLVIHVVSRTAPVALVFAVGAGYAPIGYARGRAARRDRELSEAWPDAIDHLASAVRAGMSLPEALSGLAERGPESLQPAFAGFALDYQTSGRFHECLDRLKDRLADPTGDRVIEGLRVAREVGGGDLGRLLRNLSGYLRDDARTRSELEARQAWAVNAARLAVAAPWVVLLFMSFQTEVIRRYASPAGTLVLLGGLGVCVVAYRLMIFLGRLPTAQRVAN